MERSNEEVGTQESPRHSAWQVRWLGPQRGQAARKSGERAEGRVGEKPPKDTRLSAQRASSPSSSPQAVNAAIDVVRARFGYFAIGLGEAGIRYGRDEAQRFAGSFSPRRSTHHRI
jgi:hypothetical protein